MWPSHSLIVNIYRYSGIPKVPCYSEPGSEVWGSVGNRTRALPSGFSPGYFAPFTFSATLNEGYLGGSMQVPFYCVSLWSVSRRIIGEARDLFFALEAWGFLQEACAYGKVWLHLCIDTFLIWKQVAKFARWKKFIVKEATLTWGNERASSLAVWKVFSQLQPNWHSQLKWLSKSHQMLLETWFQSDISPNQ